MPDPVAEKNDDCEDRADLNKHDKPLPEIAGEIGKSAEPVLRKEQMPRRADRQELRYSLDHPQQHRDPQLGHENPFTNPTARDIAPPRGGYTRSRSKR